MIAEVMEVTEFVAGQQVYSQGEAGSRCYIIKDGSLTSTKAALGNAAGGQPGPAMLTPGMYFGERALIQDEVRSAPGHMPCKLCAKLCMHEVHRLEAKRYSCAIKRAC